MRTVDEYDSSDWSWWRGREKTRQKTMQGGNRRKRTRRNEGSQNENEMSLEHFCKSSERLTLDLKNNRTSAMTSN